MALYYLLLDTDAFQHLRPPLADSWRLRSFQPCRALCAALVPVALAFAERYRTSGEEPLLCRVAAGLPFDRDCWRFLAGEILWLSAAEIPEIETTPESLCCLLGVNSQEQTLGREQLAPIQQVFQGARDLTFGMAFYRPGHAGYNDSSDVARLADYLAALDPQRWTPADLAALPELAEQEWAEELAFVREWFPPLEDLYRRARERNQVVVCETVP